MSTPADETCVPGLLADLFDPTDAAAFLISAPGGTGKTLQSVEFDSVLVEQLGCYLLTNILFMQKTKGGWVRAAPHERVRVISSMRDLWYQIGLIKQEDPYAYIIVTLDEWHKWLDRLKSTDQIAINFKNWYGENRKYRTVPKNITQKMANIPRRLLKYIVWYVAKSRSITTEYNTRYGKSYRVEDLAFVIPVSAEDELEEKEEDDFTLDDVAEVFLIERGLWTGDPNTARMGQICYFSESSASFEMGKVRGSEEWFDDFLRAISACHPIELGSRILAFFEEDPSRQAELENYPRADIAMHVYRHLIATMPLSANGHPLIKLGPHKGRRLVTVEVNPTNLSRWFDCSQSTLTKRFERMA